MTTREGVDASSTARVFQGAKDREIPTDDAYARRWSLQDRQLAEAGHPRTHRFHEGLREAAGRGGELVSAEGLAGRDQAKLVRAGTGGKPITDGVFPEAKEFLAGCWIVDVESPERAYEIAAEASAAPGVGGAPLNLQIEVRQVMSEPPKELL